MSVCSVQLLVVQLLEGWWATCYLWALKRCRLFINHTPLPMCHPGSEETSANVIKLPSGQLSQTELSCLFSRFSEYPRTVLETQSSFPLTFFAAHFFKNEEGRVPQPITKRFWLWQNPKVAPQWSSALTNSLGALLFTRASYRAGSDPLFCWALLLLLIIICG